jgi:hypothetical protein
MNVVSHTASRIPDSELRPAGTGGPEKEQTFSRCVRKSNITQELSQGNESPRTSYPPALQ